MQIRTAEPTIVSGRLVLDDRVADGRLTIVDGRIEAVELGAGPRASDGFIVPGFVDVHVHGWGGHDAMGGPAALDGMARALLRQGVTSFLPTAVAAPLPALVAFAAAVRELQADAPEDGAQALGFNIEGPFLALGRRGAHDLQFLLNPADVPPADLEPLVRGLRIMTIAPELPGALTLIKRLRGRGATISLGHSEATLQESRAGYEAGATSTTHLFNGMTGVDHRSPGLAVAALAEDAAFVELIADGQHVHPSLWPMIARLKPADRLVLVSDAIALAGAGVERGRVGGVAVEVNGDRATLAGTTTLAGSVIGLDSAVRNLVRSGVALPAAVGAATRNPLALLRVTDRGRLAPGQRADLVELDSELQVQRVMRGGGWLTLTA